MRAAGLPIVLLCAACQLRTVPATEDASPGDDAGPIDGPPDARPIDGPTNNAYRKQISIDPARVTGNQTAFPVWILLPTDADLAARASANGADIHFTRPDGTPLPYQIQRFTESNGHLEAWVRADLDDNAPTVIELRYGDPAVGHAADAPAVFSSSFLAVWHLDDSLGNTAIADATNQRPGAAQGGLGTSDQVPAQLGGGVDFDGSNDQITFTNPFAGGGTHTISAWVNQRTVSNFDSIVTMGNAMGGQSRWFHSDMGGRIAVGFFGPDWNGTALPTIENDNWTLLHWVFNGTTLQSRFYRDGAEVGTDTMNENPINTQGTAGYLGFAPNQWGPGGNNSCALNGILDEVRLSTAERDAGWIATEFANQNAPQTFYTVGPESKLP